MSSAFHSTQVQNVLKFIHMFRTRQLEECVTYAEGIALKNISLRHMCTIELELGEDRRGR